MSSFRTMLLILGGACALSACVEGRTSMGADFGKAVALDSRAQITNPDARYPAAVTDGARAALANDRYRTGKVITPPSASASKVGITMGATQ